MKTMDLMTVKIFMKEVCHKKAVTQLSPPEDKSKVLQEIEEQQTNKTKGDASQPSCPTVPFKTGAHLYIGEKR